KLPGRAYRRLPPRLPRRCAVCDRGCSYRRGVHARRRGARGCARVRCRGRRKSLMFKDTQAFSGFSVDDLDRAKQFYGETLGLTVTENPAGLELHLGSGATVFVYPKGDQHTPTSFTILNFPVGNIEQAVDDLVA